MSTIIKFLVQQEVDFSSGTKACIESPSYDIGDVGISVELVDLGLCSSITDLQLDVESCVQSQESVVEDLEEDVNADSMDTFDDLFDYSMRCIGYDNSCQILGDHSKEVLDGSQDQC